MANTSTGFKLTNVVDSSLEECTAIANGADGFCFVGTTSNVIVMNSKALNNSADGFDFRVTTTACLVRNNVAQDNKQIGFRNLNTAGNLFYGNVAQANTGGNYSGVSLVTTPGLTTGPFANVIP